MEGWRVCLLFSVVACVCVSTSTLELDKQENDERFLPSSIATFFYSSLSVFLYPFSGIFGAQGKASEEKQAGSRLGDFLREYIFQQDEIERPGLELGDLSHFDIKTGNIESFFLPSAPGEVGAWFMEPEEETDRDKAVLYLHGVKGNRGRSYRVGLYNVLLMEGFKVLATDYRGFGDSTDISEDEDTVVQDALVSLNWLREKVGENCDIYVWAHSLGTGIASHALAKEVDEKGDNAQVKGVILEAPFNNFTDEFIAKTSGTSNPLAQAALSALYGLTGDFVPESLLKLFNMEFNSDEHLPHVPSPVLVLHAEDDDKIPVELGQKLFETVKAAGKNNIELHLFDGSLGYKHHDIYKSAELPDLVRRFTRKV